MNAAAMWLAISARAEADTGAGGLFASGAQLVNRITYARVMSTEDMPYLMYTTAGVPEMDAFDVDVTRPIIRIAVFVAMRGSTGNTDPTARGAAILERLRGNSSGGSAPSYGFHRWAPGSVGGWTVGAFQQQDVLEEHTDEYYSWVVPYQLVCSK